MTFLFLARGLTPLGFGYLLFDFFEFNWAIYKIYVILIDPPARALS